MAQQLILKRASASRPSGEWSEDDYDVLANGTVVGHIMKAAAAPVGALDVDARLRSSRGSVADVYTATREAAMAAFAKRRRRSSPHRTR
jgi:hypothetical protein